MSYLDFRTVGTSLLDSSMAGSSLLDTDAADASLGLWYSRCFSPACHMVDISGLLTQTAARADMHLSSGANTAGTTPGLQWYCRSLTLVSRTSHHQQAAEPTLKHWNLFFDSEWTALCLVQTESLPNSRRGTSPATLSTMGSDTLSGLWFVSVWAE